MSDYRSSLEAGVHPATDPRRGAELRAELERLAEALTPRWRPARDRDDFGHALLRIGARLAEQSTVRLDASARRDALAFFDFLGLTPRPPRPATGVLVLALDPKHVAPVHAPARTQVAVTTAGGAQATFETQSRLRLVPGGIADLYSVDPANDRIDQAPARVTAVTAPSSWVVEYRLVTFAGAGGETVQLSPAAGLEQHDLLQFGTSVYRVHQADKNGLVTLLDALEAPADAKTLATRVTAFRTFNLRNVQRHEVLIGHRELLNVEQEASITVDLEPVSLARQLGALEIDFALYGTRKGQDKPDWQPLDLLGVSGSGLRLAKTWLGPVDETNVSGHKNRWIRARLRTAITDESSATTRAADLRLTVASSSGDAGSDGGASVVQGQASHEEGSRTVIHAAHNGTPLATTGRFYPFGSEPIRFDTFALAAPEALSKKGATVSLTFELADSSMKSFGLAVHDPQVSEAKNWHGFGVGATGDLQAISTEDGRVRWSESTVKSEDGRRIHLGDMTPVSVNLSMSGTDLVVAEDRDGGLWGGIVRREGSPTNATDQDNWHLIERRQDSAATSRGAPLATPAPLPVRDTAAVILDVLDGELHAQRVGRDAQPILGWTLVKPSAGDGPELTSPRQLAPIQGSAYPQRPDHLDIVARDAKGMIWYGRLIDPKTGEFPEAGDVDVAWTSLGSIERADQDEGGSPQKEVPRSRGDVVPAATWYRDAGGGKRLWVVFAPSEATSPEGLRGIDVIVRDDGSLQPAELAQCAGSSPAPGSTLHAHPGILGLDERPVVVGLGPTKMQVLIWQGEQKVRTTPVDEKVSTTGPLLVLSSSTSGDEPAEILVPAHGERLFRSALPQNIRYELHNLVDLEAPEAAYRLEILPSPGATEAKAGAASAMITLDEENLKIVEKRHRVFSVDSPAFEAGRSLRYMKLHNEGTPFIGAFATAGNHQELTLDEDDEVSKEKSRIVIGRKTYVIEELSEGSIATLNRSVRSADWAGGESVEYYVVLGMVPGRVNDENLGTLAKLQTAEAPDELAFGPSAKPATQRIRRSSENKSPGWVQFAEPWQTKPPDGTASLVTSPFTWKVDFRPRDYRDPELSWEYFDGEAWQQIVTEFLDGTHHLSASGTISFVVPHDLKTTEVGGKDGYWIRARLIGGDYGRPTYRVTEQEQKEDGVKTQSVVVDTSELNPPEVIAIEASFSGPDRVRPQIVLVENNGDVLDQTQAALAPSATFELFQGAAALGAGDTDRARVLIVGLTGPVEAGPLTMFVDAEDQPGSGTLQVDVRMPDGWRRVAVDDGTASLRRAGLITMSLGVSPVPLRLFGQDRLWFRFRAGDDSAAGTGQGRADEETWAPVVRSLLPNAVPISHAKTMGMEILGSSLGEPETTVYLSSVPVLPDSVELRVREDLSEEERTALQEQHRGRGGTQEDANRDIVRTDPLGAPGTWVLWGRVDSLIGQAKDARVYVLEPRTGRVAFGDDRTGRIPPAGRDGIRCFSYQQGGGADGNVPAWAETKLTGAVAGVDTAVLPLGTAGGADAPPADELFATAPHQLRHAGRAVTPADIEDLAVASSGDVLRACCRRPTGPEASIRVAIVVRDRASRCPEPTYAQREAVAAFIRASGWGGLDGDTLHVSGPDYVPVALDVELIAPPESWAEVQQVAMERLVDFFDPEHGGPHGTGWAFGRWPTKTDVLRVLRHVPGLDRIATVDIAATGGTPAAELPPVGMVCAEPVDITVTVSAEGRAS